MKVNMFGRGFKLQLAIIAACQMAFILFGYDQGVFSGIVGNEDFLNIVKHPDSAVEGIIVAVYNLGAFSGCIVNFFTAEITGRRRAMWFAMAFIIVGAALQCTSYSTAQIIVARYVTGIGTGIETSTVPMYQSELCEASKRGRIVSAEPLFVGIGIVISYWFDYGMSFTTGGVAWRVPIACQVVFALVVIVLVFGLPESPRYLYRCGRNDEALQVLCDVYDGQPDDEKIRIEQDDILETLETERETGEYKWSEIFTRDEVQTGKRVLLAYGMQFMNQMGGINLVVYYVTSVLQDNVHLSRNLSLLLGGVIQIMFPIGSLVPALFLDKLGRRNPMMWGSFGLAICMMMISILLSIEGTSYASASVAFFFIYMLIFGSTANCIPWVYVPEILPLHARAKGVAVGISANWLWNFFVVMITPTLITSLSWKAYLIFMCLNLSFVPLVFFVYPETANLTLEEMDYLFTRDEGQKGTKKSLGRTEDVIRSLERERLGGVKERNRVRRGSLHVGSTEAGRAKGFETYADKEKEGAEHMERARSG